MPLREAPQPGQMLEQYVSATHRSANDFLLVLERDPAPEVGERILEILLTPDLKKLPLSIRPKTPRDARNYLGEDAIRRLRGTLQGKEALAVKAADLVTGHLKGLRGDGYRTTSDRYDYQEVILTLLPILPPDKADELFSHFDFNTRATYDHYGEGFHSPYLLRRALGDPNIADRYKRKVADDVHKVIEKKGFLGLGGDVEGRAQYYAQELEYLINENTMWRDSKQEGSIIREDFLTDEITYLMGIDTGEQLFHSWTATSVAIRLLGLTEIGRSFLRRQFLPLNGDNRLADSLKEARKACDLIVLYFPQDEELTNRIRSEFRQLAAEESSERGIPRPNDKVLIKGMRARS